MFRRPSISYLLIPLLSTCISAQTLAEPVSQDMDSVRSMWSVDSKYFSTARPVTGDTGYTIIGEWRWGHCLAAAAIGNYLFIGNGGLLQVLEVSNRTTPQVVFEMNVALVRDIVVHDTLACVGTADGKILVLNVNEPNHPTLLGEVTLPFPNGPLSLAMADSFAYVVTTLGVVFSIDISNPRTPFWRGYVNTLADEFAEISLRNKRLHLASGIFGEHAIIDVTNPDSLRMRSLHFPGGHSVFASDTLLFEGFGFGLKIFSIANPDTLVLLGQAAIDASFISGIVRSNDYLYLNTNNGLYVVDVSGPSQPLVVDRKKRDIPADGGFRALTLSNNTIFAGLVVGVWILDITQQDTLRPLSYFPTGDYVQKIALKENLAFVADGDAGLWILDITDPANIQNLANVNVGASALDVIVSDQTVYIAAGRFSGAVIDSARGLWIIDVMNPAQPKVLGHTRALRPPISGIFNAYIARNNNNVFFTNSSPLNDSAVAIIDVSNPTTPSVVSVFMSGIRPTGIAAMDTIVFVTSSDSGLRVINVRNPLVPFELGSALSNSLGLAVQQNKAYVAEGGGLAVVDVSAPSLPVVLGSTPPLWSSPFSLDLASGFALVASNDALRVVDVRDPTAPREVAVWLRDYDPIRAVVVKSDSVVLAGLFGFFVLRTNLTTSVDHNGESGSPELVKLMQNYPNPFNSTTTIEYRLPRRTSVELKMFSILGEQIAILVNDEQEAGTHKISFASPELPSGVYFYQMKTDRGTFARAMMILK